MAVAIAIFPVPIIAVVLMVGSDRGTMKGLAFVLAWSAGLALVVTIVLAFAAGLDARRGGEPAIWANVLLLGLGVLALAAAIKQWRGRPSRAEETAVPRWMRAVDGFTVSKAGGAGFALSALNPKNVLLTGAAAVEIAELGLPASQQIGTALVFVFIASVGVITPLVLSLALGERSREVLGRLRAWMTRHSAAIMSVLLLLIGAKLIGDSLSGFFS